MKAATCQPLGIESRRAKLDMFHVEHLDGFAAVTAASPGFCIAGQSGEHVVGQKRFSILLSNSST